MMADMILYFFAALGVCFTVLELFRSYGNRRLSVWIGERQSDLCGDTASEPDIIIICRSGEKDKILDALAEKYKKISVETEKTT